VRSDFGGENCNNGKPPERRYIELRVPRKKLEGEGGI